ncbi:MAG TPA: extensin family protein, partial [Casimicrobiaceae bacterium]|nr:extensin family protein [Casimicrobiaceae bacterium]
MLSHEALLRQVAAMVARIVGSALVLLIAAFATMLATGSITLPDRWNPAAPLAIADKPNLLTGYKLTRVERSAEQCRISLATSDFRYQPLPDREFKRGCGYEAAVRVDATSLRLSEPFTLTCPAAVALALWERHVVQPAAQRH